LGDRLGFFFVNHPVTSRYWTISFDNLWLTKLEMKDRTSVGLAIF